MKHLMVRSIKKGIEFLYPFIADKTKWPLQKDVMYWEQLARGTTVFSVWCKCL